MMNLPDDFCIFILTHGRPDKVHTFNTLQKCGYQGKVYIVIDDEDKTADEYRRRFGDRVLQFCKSDLARDTDEGDNFKHRKAIVYARNACWDLARQVGCKYFVQFDDDYTTFQLRFDSNNQFCSPVVHKTLNEIIGELLAFYKKSNATAIAMAQGGDFIGGGEGGKKPRLGRKCMNSWFCDVDREFRFFGHMNEDVSAYVTYGRRGQLFMTVLQAMLVQKPTQVTAGGMSDLYLSQGTYVKSFYTVMAAPSCCKIGELKDGSGNRGARVHHKINWNIAVPKILDEKHRKQDDNTGSRTVAQ